MSVTLIIIVTICVCIFLIGVGSPIFLALGSAGVLGIYFQGGFAGLSLIQTSIFGSVSKFTLVAAPLFILMGEIIFHSGVSSDLYKFLSRVFGRLPNGLAVATIFASAIFGAMCGVSIAAVATISVIALPEMLKRGYDPKLAAGAVCAPGALAMLIPPSLLFILYGEVAGVSVGKLFTAGILPGILLAGLMSLYVMMRSVASPNKQNVTNEYKEKNDESHGKTLVRLAAPLVLIMVVLGSIYLGIATPTESAAIGVFGAYAVAVFIYKSFSWEKFNLTLVNSARISGMIFIIYVGAVIFTQFLNLVRVPDICAQFIVDQNLSPWITMLVIQLMLIGLGMFVDGGSLVLIITPILLPTMVALKWDPIWFGVLMVTNIEMAVITPPVGLNLYTLASVTNAVDMKTIIRGTLPYVLVELVGLVILIAFPQISLWLPSLMH